eukprot:TRINITY_DN4482_c0_g1_i4.p2 TRINITY_DN4482_c0_g1~~TRINITY_DN4482_c0_g1_i4.p2  ORF type:complete len:189 (+),score=-17.26 TRINITY_DN4482_c0_g1_i4:134-700(+)
MNSNLNPNIQLRNQLQFNLLNFSITYKYVLYYLFHLIMPVTNNKNQRIFQYIQIKTLKTQTKNNFGQNLRAFACNIQIMKHSRVLVFGQWGKILSSKIWYTILVLCAVLVQNIHPHSKIPSSFAKNQGYPIHGLKKLKQRYYTYSKKKLTLKIRKTFPIHFVKLNKIRLQHKYYTDFLNASITARVRL